MARKTHSRFRFFRQTHGFSNNSEPQMTEYVEKTRSLCGPNRVKSIIFDHWSQVKLHISVPGRQSSSSSAAPCPQEDSKVVDFVRLEKSWFVFLNPSDWTGSELVDLAGKVKSCLQTRTRQAGQDLSLLTVGKTQIRFFRWLVQPP